MRKELLDALPFFAKMSGGYAMLTTKDGTVLQISSAHDKKPFGDEHMVITEFRGDSGVLPSFVACPADKKQMWVIPMGGYILCVSRNEQKDEIYARIRQNLEDALPSIAKVAGGEAVVFDSAGLRMSSVNSDGEINRAYIGQVSKKARKSMSMRKTLVGPSTYIVGAKGVRIPLCEEFGLGFNNNDYVGQRQRLMDRIYSVAAECKSLDEFLGESERIAELRKAVSKMAELDNNLILAGENGTGKEMAASYIHSVSSRKLNPFVTVNCDTLDQDLVEAIIFGYADAALKGLRCGANRGALVSASGGTLFLKNAEHLRKDIQIRLTKTILQGEFHPVGNFKKNHLDAKIIISTGSGIFSLVDCGFVDRAFFDCFYDNMVLFPSLKQINSDIPCLVKGFIEQFNREYGRRVEGMEQDAMNLLKKKKWTGNVGELREFIRRLYETQELGALITKKHFSRDEEEPSAEDNAASDGCNGNKVLRNQMIEGYESQIIRNALLNNGGSRKLTAAQLGISTVSLWRKMKKYGISYKEKE